MLYVLYLVLLAEFSKKKKKTVYKVIYWLWA